MTPTEVRLAVEIALVTAVVVGVASIGVWEFVVRARREGPVTTTVLAKANSDLAVRVRSLEWDRANDLEMLLGLQRRFELQATFSRAQTEYIQRQASHIEVLADRLRHLRQDVPPGPGDPPVPPPELSRPMVLRAVRPESDRVAMLPALLDQRFNNEELDDLGSQIGARPEDLKGETVARRAVSLVQWAQRRNRLDALILTARELRPNGGFDSFVN